MGKAEQYRELLTSLADWEPFLLRESRLPGPRANLELVQAAADVGDEATFLRLIAATPEDAAGDSPEVFLAVCGLVGLGCLVAAGQRQHLAELRRRAGDRRWRVREAVAMALQRVGDADVDALIAVADEWSRGSLLERRAAVAALCEPRLLAEPRHVARVLQVLDGVTGSLAAVADRRSDDFRVLRQTLGYCWSVAVAALPETGKPLMERLLASPDRDVVWIARENLRKNRLARMDAEWVSRLTGPLTGRPRG